MDPTRIQPVRVSDGIVLRPMSVDDAPLIVSAGASDVPDWTFIPRAVDREGAAAWIRRDLAARETGRAVRFVIEVEDGDAGTVGGRHPDDHDPGVVETFYFILPEFRRRGLATTALGAIDDWFVRAVPELRRLQLHVIPGNPGSEQVAVRAGYVREGVAANRIPPANGFPARDGIAYAKRVSAR